MRSLPAPPLTQVRTSVSTGGDRFVTPSTGPTDVVAAPEDDTDARLVNVERWQRAKAATVEYDGVISRTALRQLGVDRKTVGREVAAGRWTLHGHETVSLHPGPLSLTALWWRALWEVGPCAALDGVSALQAAGVRGLETAAVQVSVPRDYRRRTVVGVRQRRVSRLDDEVIQSTVPRVRPAVAALRAASWAVSDRQAALIMVLPVQQRILLGAHLVAASSAVHVRARRTFIRQLAADIADGAQSLGELDFAVLCRRRGLPEPARQVVRRTAGGRIYLDVRWPEIGLTVEIDGSGHRVGLAVTHDNLRQNGIAIGGETVLRIDLIGLRLETEAFLDQVCEAYRVLSVRCGAKRVGIRSSVTTPVRDHARG